MLAQRRLQTACTELQPRLSSRASAYRSRRSDAGPREVSNRFATTGGGAVGAGNLSCQQSQPWAGRALVLGPMKSACHREASRTGWARARSSASTSISLTSSWLWQRVLPSAAIMARLIVALACAAGVSAFLAPSAPTARAGPARHTTLRHHPCRRPRPCNLEHGMLLDTQSSRNLMVVYEDGWLRRGGSSRCRWCYGRWMRRYCW